MSEIPLTGPNAPKRPPPPAVPIRPSPFDDLANPMPAEWREALERRKAVESPPVVAAKPNPKPLPSTKPTHTGLVACPDCHREISHRATACPHCGAPMMKAVQLVEQTSKQFKASILIGVLLMLTGLPLVFALPPLGAVMLFAGITCYITGRSAAWWHHG